jgi:predicted PurR-regulated permease PerM
MLAIGFVTGISDNIARTWVLKGRGQMHPLVSLIAIFGGIRLFGIFGVFIGPILAALLISVLNIWPTMAERFGVLHGERSPNRIATTKKHRQRSSH